MVTKCCLLALNLLKSMSVWTNCKIPAMCPGVEAYVGRTVLRPRPTRGWHYNAEMTAASSLPRHLRARVLCSYPRVSKFMFSSSALLHSLGASQSFACHYSS
jgi:hypothetical protein